MARKTKRPRPTRPAATPDAETIKAPDIADAETLPGHPIEDAEILGEAAVSPADDTVLASEPEPGAAGAATLGDDSLTDGDVVSGEVPPDAETLPGADAPVPETETLGDDTVPPEDEADTVDLARMDGASEAEIGAASYAPEADDTRVAAESADTLRTAGDDGTEGVLVGEIRSDDADPVDRADRSPETPPAVVPPPPHTSPPQGAEKRGPGFLPLVLGGLVAGAIGYAIPTFLAPPPPPPDDARIAALEARVDELPAGGTTDLSAIEAAQSDLSDRIDALAARIDALESAPPEASAAEQSAAASTAAPDEGSAALETLRAEVAGLSDLGARVDALAAEVEALSGLGARVDTLAATVEGLPAPPPDLSERVAALEAGLAERIGTLESELTALGEETEAVEVSAEQLAREAAANQLRIAFDSGVPYAEPLSVIGGDAPAVLSENAEAGLPTDGALAADFPAAARAALTEARRARPGDDGGLVGFIRRQTGARSLEPREGDDADAVLSRAEAAMRAGDAEAALAELEALPPEAQAAMSDWIARARTRAEARAALQDYLGTE